MQIPILNGIYSDKDSDFRSSYPINLIPVPKQSGISNGYLRPAEGVNQFAKTSGLDRGGINWNDECYRVIDEKFVKVSADGTITELGLVDNGGYVTFDYSFDYLAICSNGKLYLYNRDGLREVTDEDLISCKDIIFIDGYFMTTDGEYIIVNELNNPFEINPLKYGSAEIDPDPIIALKKIRNEAWAIGRYTIEVFDNTGGDNFPFQRVEGAMIPKGCVGTKACCHFAETLAFLGSAKNEPVAIWLASNGSGQKISNREIDQILHTFTEKQLSECLMESRSTNGHMWLYLHLPDQTLVYDYAASSATQEPVWFKLSTGLELSQYTARNHVWCYDKWIVGHSSENKIGTLTDKHSHQWGNPVSWEFQTSIVYNEGRGAIFHSLELVALTGHVEFNKNPAVYTQYSVDGELWSMPKHIHSGKIGNRAKRLIWLQQGRMQHWRIQKFKGTSDSRLSFARIEASIEPLGV